MCDMIPAEMYEVGHPFLEPCCGNGNFLVEILRRKLDRCSDREQAKAAVADIYGIDIQADNVEESKARMQEIIAEKFPWLDVSEILDRNIICGNSLEIMEEWINEEQCRENVSADGAAQRREKSRCGRTGSGLLRGKRAGQ